MSDPKSSYGEPVEEPRSVDDVVGRANEGLADAEAARRDAAASHTPATEESVGTTEPGAAERSDPASSAPAPATSKPVADDPDPWDSPEAASLDYTAPAPVARADDAPTVVATPVVTPSEPVVSEPAAGSAPAPQPIFVQAPEAPRPRGNRAAAGAIGLLAALSFAILYLAVWLGVRAIEGDVTAENVGSAALQGLGTWSLWLPVVVFFVAFWLLGAIINRGRWGYWVVFGILVGVAAYGGHILGALFQAPFWNLTASQGADLVETQLLAPLAIAAFVIGRELTIWFGAWAAARAKRVTELNLEAQREYERTLEAGPQLVHA